MKFHFALFSLTWVTLKGQSMAYISKSIQDNHRVTIGDGWEVIYEVSFGAIVFDLEWLCVTVWGMVWLERSIQVTQIFNDLYLQISSR